jgi:hypothetical protein
MPENSEPTESTFNVSSLNSTIVAIAKVGNGSSRALPIRSCCSRLFHKVDGGKTTCEYQSTNNSEVLLAEHSLQVWGS